LGKNDFFQLQGPLFWELGFLVNAFEMRTAPSGFEIQEEGVPGIFKETGYLYLGNHLNNWTPINRGV